MQKNLVLLTAISGMLMMIMPTGLLFEAYADTQTSFLAEITDLTTTTDHGSFLEITNGTMFGYDIVRIDDMNGDGIPELAVSGYGCPDENCNNAPVDVDGDGDFYDYNGGDEFAANMTSIRILFMNEDGSVKDYSLLTFDDAPGTGIGRAGMGVGNDNCLDYHFGTPTEPTSRNSTHAIFVPNNGFVKETEANWSNPITDAVSNPWVNEEIEYLGLMDLDGTGAKPTIAASMYNAHYSSDDSGGVLLISLENDGTMASCNVIVDGVNGFENPSESDSRYAEPEFDGDNVWFGWPLIATDVNRDGIQDLIVGQDYKETTDLEHLTCNSDNDTREWLKLIQTNSSAWCPDYVGNTDTGSEYEPYSALTELIVIFMDEDGTPKDDNSEHTRILPTEFEMDHRFYRWLESGTSINNEGKILVGSSSGSGKNHEGIWILNLDTLGNLSSFNKIQPDDISHTDYPDLCTFEDNGGNSVPGYIRNHVQASYPDFEFPQVCLDQIGRDVASAGDFNKDGYDDVLIADQKRGLIYAFYLGANDSVLEIHQVADGYTDPSNFFGHGLEMWHTDGQHNYIAIGAHEYESTTVPYDEDDERGAVFIYDFYDNDSPTFQVSQTDILNPGGATYSLNFTTYLNENDVYSTGDIVNIVDENPGTTVSTIFDLDGIDGTMLSAGTYTVVYNVTDAEGDYTIIGETVNAVAANELLPTFNVDDMFGQNQTDNFVTTLEFGTQYDVGTVDDKSDPSLTTSETIEYFNEFNESSFTNQFGDEEPYDFDAKTLNPGIYYVQYTVTDTDNDRSVSITEKIVVEGIVITLETNNHNGDGCSDCTPPTFGKNKAGAQVVSGGFAFNSVAPVDVTDYHTDFPLITVITNVTNTATVKVYENQGVSSIAMVQFGLGMPKVGSPLNDAQTLVEISLAGGDVDEIELVDSNNLVDVTDITTQTVKCTSGYSTDCLELSMKYVYRDQPKYNIMAINAIDLHRNSQTNYMNDGILVTGESINDPLTQKVSVSNSNSHYPQKAGLVTLTLVDYKTDMWQDEFGYMWSTNEYGPYLVDTIPQPIREPDAFSNWSGYNDRLHSEFEDYKQKHTQDIMKQMSKLYSDADSFTTSPDFYLQKHIHHDFEKSGQCSDMALKLKDRCNSDERVQFEIQKAQKVMDVIMDNPGVPYEVLSKSNGLTETLVYESLSPSEMIVSKVKSTAEKQIAFAEIDFQNNILTISGNIGQADKTIPAKAVIYYEGGKMRVLPLYVTDNGDFSFVLLSPTYEKVVIEHNDVQIH